MEDKKKYVPNDVFKYRVSLDFGIDINVYVRPFPKPWDKDYSETESMSLEDKENLIQEKYFTKERIDGLKQKLIEKIVSEENPFEIQCVDYDGDYKVTEEQIFKF
jgi:hypothetical protein